jgi:hypothetical protein
MVTLTRGVGRAGLAAPTALAVIAPAGAHATGHGVDRPGQPVAQTFLQWVDSAWYVSAPDVDPTGNADRPGGATDRACLVRSRRNAQAPPATALP